MSFQQGLSGLSAAAKNLEVIGNNLANANTIGSKASRAEFADLFASTVGGNSSVGIGARVAAVSQDFTQGSLTTTGNNLDLALSGPGFFQVRSAGSNATNGTSGELLYSRNGQFKVDSDGYIVNNDGMRLVGYGADAQGNILAGQLSALAIPSNLMAPKQTTTAQIKLNLDSLDDIPTTAFSPSDGTSFNYGTSVKIYDAAGREVDLGLYFRKTALASQWDVYATANGVQLPGTATRLTWSAADGSAPPVAAFGYATGPLSTTLTFPDTVLETALNLSSSPPAATTGIFYDFGTSPVVLDFAESSQRASDYLVESIDQDGFAVGTLSSYSFDRSGILTARYDNGEVVRTGQVALANFTNLNGLVPTGGNNWLETRDAGTKTVNAPGTGVLGEVLSGTLEESNVDITEELVNLITAQRTYQANAQTIKTQDQVLQTFLNR